MASGGEGVIDATKVRLVLGENPVLVKKKTYFDWDNPIIKPKFKLAKIVKHRNAHLPKMKGGLNVSQNWELVMSDVKSDPDKTFESLVISDWKSIQSTFNRFRDEVLRVQGVTKDAINLSGLPRVDEYSALVLQMAKEAFDKSDESKQKTGVKKRKVGILENIAGTELNKQGRLSEETPTESNEVDPIKTKSSDGDSSFNKTSISATKSSSRGASAFIMDLTEEIKTAFSSSSKDEVKEAQLKAADASTRASEMQIAYYQMMIAKNSN